MKVVSNVTDLRPAQDIVAMLRKLADEIEARQDVENVFVVVQDEDNTLDIFSYGPCDHAYEAAGQFTRAAHALLHGGDA